MNHSAVARTVAVRPLSECGRILTGGTPSRSKPDYWGGDVPWISAKSLKRFDVADSEERLTAAGATDNTTLVPANSILFVVRGMSLANEFRVGVTQRPVTFNQDLRALIPAEDIDARYLGRFLQASQTTVLGLADEASHGTKRLTSDRLAAIQVPVPPLPDQQRIAEVLDRAEALRAKRRAALALVESLPQALFVESFGKPMSGDRRWPVVKVGEAGRVQLGRQRAPQYQSGAHTRPYMRVANVYENHIDLSDVLSMDFDETDFPAYRLEVGDILLNEGQSTELVGRPAMWRGELPDCCFQNTLVRFQADRNKTLPEFALTLFLYYLRSGEFAKVSSKTSNVAHLGAGRFANMPFPLPPLPLQQEFARRVAAVEQLKSRHRESLGKLDELFASLQHRAFRGEL